MFDSEFPTVSVVMPVYNAERFLRVAVESVLQQTFTDFEFIIINDGSTDKSDTIVQSFNDARIRSIVNQQNMGVTIALNKAIELCKGRYIARMDADDVSMPERLQRQVEYLHAHPEISLVASVAEMIDLDGEHLGWWNTDRENISEAEIRSTIARTNCIAHPTIMIRAEVMKAHGYRQEKNAAEDYDLWLRLISHGHRIAKLNEPLLRYRIHQQSVTANAKLAVSNNLRVFRQKSVFLMYAMRSFRVNSFFFRVLYSAARSYGAYMKEKIPGWLSSLKRVLTISPFHVFDQLKTLQRTLAICEPRYVFFFPYTHMGGAERVHADIVQAFAKEKCLVVFTGFSNDESFLFHFRHSNTEVLLVPECLHHPFTKKKARIAFQHFVKSKSELRTLGSNSGYYYELLPDMPADAICVDVIHAFKFQPGANLAHLKYLPLAMRLNKRVFVSQNAQSEFVSFLKHHLHGPEVSGRLAHITNATDAPTFLEVKSDRMAIIFVGRDSSEKRFHLFERIALQLKPRYTDITFETAGVAKQTDSLIAHHGKLDDEALNKLYQRACMLVLCSSREGFPMVVMEAMVNGVVPLCTAVGDIPNHINHTNGVLIYVTDETEIVNEFCKAIVNLYANKQLCQQLSVNACEYAQQHFSRSVFEEAYRKLLE
ncbi:MAG: glycosyltransferase [Flavobacteriales bacterium]